MHRRASESEKDTMNGKVARPRSVREGNINGLEPDHPELIRCRREIEESVSHIRKIREGDVEFLSRQENSVQPFEKRIEESRQQIHQFGPVG